MDLRIFIVIIFSLNTQIKYVMSTFLVNFRFNDYGAVKWYGHTIPYIWDDNLEPNDYKVVREAMAVIERNSCVRFVNDPSATWKILIGRSTLSRNCGGSVGMTVLNAIMGGERCYSRPGFVLHELMHNLGFLHEHQRPDRDRYIRMLYENIPDHLEHYYNKMPADTAYTLGSAYDPYSIMHYQVKLPRNDGTLSKPKMQILVHGWNETMVGQKETLSEGDIWGLNAVYCSGDRRR